MQLDAAASRALKERGMQLALDMSGDWPERIVLEFRGWAAIEKARGLATCTVERFRAEARNQPAKHQVWGSLPGLLRKAKLIEPKWLMPGVQARAKAASPKTHAHEVKVWVLL